MSSSKFSLSQRLLLPDRFVAAAIHLFASLTIATLIAITVFALWFPGDYRELAGGNGLFWIIVSVDVILGPVLTLVIFDRRKSIMSLRCDLAAIGLLQAVALFYGLHAIYSVRPIALVFEVDRFRVVAAADVAVDELNNAPIQYRNLPKMGPWELGTRIVSPEEKIKVIEFALKGFDVGQRPAFWQPYADSRLQIVSRSRAIGELLEKYPESVDAVMSKSKDVGLPRDAIRFLPVVARSPDWVALIDGEGFVFGFLKYDGFF